MHGSPPAELPIRRRLRRHMWPVPPSNATTVASDPGFFTKDGRKIGVGDCALFKPPRGSPPFVGIIRWLKLDKGDSLSLGVNWLYRPADVKLLKGVSPEAAPNEVFYSFHKDEIPAASLLHPCKVTFLRKGVELPTGISSFVCRRVFDTENKCLWWLTDKDYINERQEEVDHLLDKTKLEMHGVVPSGGRSPKPLNGPPSTPQFKSGSDSLQNSASSFSSQCKGKKRERGDQSSDPVKRERLVKTEDAESGQARAEDVLKSELSNITDKGGLVDLEAVEKLVQLMQPDNGDKKIDMAGRILLVDVIAVTDRVDCLGRFVQLRGLAVLDEWLQEVHKGKIGDGSSPKQSDKSIDEFLFALLRALDKLPVNLHALQTCNIGKSVNNLRTHKNSEIQKKARTLVDTWKKRVEAEMKLNESKSGSSRGVNWPSKPASSEVSQVGSRKTGSMSEVGSKSCPVQPSASKSPQVKVGSSEMISKSSTSPGSTQLLPVSTGNTSKDQNYRILGGAGNNDVQLMPIKEERSSSSQNNSQSSDRAKNVGSLYKEDARSSSAGSVSATKLSSSPSRQRKSSNGLHGSAVSGVHKETGPGKVGIPNKHLISEKASTAGVCFEKNNDVPMVDQASSRLIVRLPNTGRSPARGASGGSLEDHVTAGRASLSAEKHGNQDKKPKSKSDALLGISTSDMNSAVCHSKDELCASEEKNVPAISSEKNRAGEDSGKPIEDPKDAGPGSEIISRTGKSYEASLSSMNALIESCVKFSEGGDTASPGDDVGMNLLASVAAGEFKSEDVSPSCSPLRNSPVPDGSFTENDSKLKELDEAKCLLIGNASSSSTAELRNTGNSLRVKSESGHSVIHLTANVSAEIKSSSAGECNDNLKFSSNMQQNVYRPSLVADGKPIKDASGSELSSCPIIGGFGKAEECNQPHEQGKFGACNAKECSTYECKSKVSSALNDEDKILHKAEERTVSSSTPVVSEAASGSGKVVKANEKSACLSTEVTDDNPVPIKDSSIALLAGQGLSGVTENHSDLKEGRNEDAFAFSCSGNTLQLQLKGENTDEEKTMDHSEQTVKDERAKSVERKDASEHISEFSEETKERKEASGHCSAVPVSRVQSPVIHAQENHKAGCKLEAIESRVKEERQISSVNASGSDTAVKLDFDLNEGFPVDDGIQQEFVRTLDHGTPSSVHIPCPLPFQMSSMSGSFPASITVVAPAKGSFVPPENPMRSKGELGWKGSTARSAFRPAEPRKNLEAPISTSDPPVDTASSKQGRLLFDFDLNVPDERVYEDVISQTTAHVMDHKSGSRDRGAGGLDLDLNRVDESSDIVTHPVINNSRLEIPPPNRSSLSGGLSNGGINDFRDFDLNNGPGLDEVGSEATPYTLQHIKSSVPLRTPVSGLRMNNPDFGNFSAWFPHGNSYPAITVPPIFPGRGEQSYGVAAGSQRVLCPPSGKTSFGPEMYRGPVLSSSTAMPFPPATTFQYPGFPFETNYPLSSGSFSGCSPAYVDSTSGGALCFPTMPSQLMAPGGVVSSPYPRPYMVNLAGSSNNAGLDGRKWGSQGLDLNSGPGGAEAEPRDERLPAGLRQLSVPSSQSLVEEQMKLCQVGGLLKRKEPDSGLDASDRMSYKQPWP
ncbi:uncharacterized protein LOC126799521 [Argentina anserina]|uniref:uncharacterized protein LOC126799521 n=1 Tax=Argentina anserina TaxID=57926 RepID=UPI00217674CA|nr:uncharacterized protein LOC126799521 [Potentilla anserina]